MQKLVVFFDASSADRANVVFFLEPSDDACEVEDMASVALERCHFISAFELCKANDTAGDSLETLLVELSFRY